MFKNKIKFKKKKRKKKKKNFPQFVVIHTVKGYSVVIEAEVDVFSYLTHSPRNNLVLKLIISNMAPSLKLQTHSFY